MGMAFGLYFATSFPSYARAIPATCLCYARILPTSFPPSTDVIPAKAGIQTVAVKPAARNQVQIAVSGSPLPLWEKARMRVSPRASAALRAGRPRSQGRCKLPLWEMARVKAMALRRARGFARGRPDLLRFSSGNKCFLFQNCYATINFSQDISAHQRRSKHAFNHRVDG